MKKSLAILSMKCPRCYEGDLFINHSPFPLSQLHKMPDHCKACGLKFNPEPGFYTGAMYVSYAINIGLFIMSFFVLYIGLKMDVVSFLLIYGISLLLLSPFLFRYSRTLFLYLFYDYKPQAKQDYLKSLHLYKQA
jgi:uncharacterized protein (DUF983 family)